MAWAHGSNRLFVADPPCCVTQRPYAAKVAGVPLHASFEMESRKYTFRWANPAADGSAEEVPQTEALTSRPPRAIGPVYARETEFYLPRRRYGQAAREGRLRVALKAGDGEWKYDEQVSPSFFQLCVVCSFGC